MVNCEFERYDMNRKKHQMQRIVLGAAISVAFLAGSTAVGAKGPPPTGTVLSCPLFYSACAADIATLCGDIEDAHYAAAGAGEKSLSDRDTNALIVKTMSIDEKLYAWPPKYADALEKTIAVQDTVCALVQEDNTGALPDGCGGKKAKVLLYNAELIYASADRVLACINDLMTPPVEETTVLEPASTTDVTTTETSTTETSTGEPGTGAL